MTAVTSATAAEQSTPTDNHLHFVVPLEYTHLAKNGFRELYKTRQDIILDALAATAPVNPELIKAMSDFTENCDDLSLIPTYIQDLVSGRVIPPERIPLDGVKFSFLSSLIKILRDETLLIAVCARNASRLELLERLLSLYEISYDRPTERSLPPNPQVVSNLKFTLLSTDSNATGLDSADIVIAFDSSYKPDLELLKPLLRHPTEKKPSTIVLQLVMKESVEHISYFTPAEEDVGRGLQITVASLVKRFDGASRSIKPPGVLLTTVQMIVAWYKNGVGQESWPIQVLPAMAEPELFHTEQNALAALVAQQRQEAIGDNSVSVSRKRAFDNLTVGQEHTKRQRSLPPEAVTLDLQGAITTSQQALPSAESSDSTTPYPAALGSPIHLDIKEEDPAPEETQPEHSIEEYKESLSLPDRVELYRLYALRLRESLKLQSERFEETQLRFEYLNIAQKRTRKDLRKSEKLVETLTARRQRANEDIQKLRDEKRALAEELQTARDELAASAVPGQGELESARAETRVAEAEAKRNSARVESLNRDFDFMRSSYQEASTAAAEAATEIVELKAQIEELERRANGESLKLRERMESSQIESLKAENDELRARLEEREDMLARKEDEVRTIFAARGGRGGMITRATSVPRSPRPMSRAVSPLPASSPLLGQIQAQGQVPVHLSPLSKAPHTVHSR